MIQELEEVALTSDLPDYGLKSGDIGMVLHVYRQGAGYEAEFVTLDGELVTLVVLRAEQVRRTGADEIAHARKVETAL